MNDQQIPGRQRGKYIVLEGPEGVGKTTQIQELTRRLQLAGLPVRVLREPDSQSDLTARAIRQLTQDPRYPMNTRTEVLLYNAARSQSLQVIKNSVQQGLICIVDRNYLTTLAIQYYGRGDVPDYATINNIISFAVDDVEPDLCIVLDAPASTLKSRAHDRATGERFDNLDEMFLERVRAGYLWEAKQRQFPVIDASAGIEAVSDSIWKLVTASLASRKPPITPSLNSLPATSVSDTKATTELPLLQKNKNGSYTITDAGNAWLADAVTNVDGPVYATKSKLESITAAAAMARLSRRGDDMRVIILDEFANKTDKDDALVRRVITAYGDDSVQQLVGQHMVIEGASNLLTKKLEWGRMAAYLEQSTRYIYYDQKDANGRYKYYVPKYLKKSIKKEYIIHMDALFDKYSAMVHTLTEYVRSHSDVAQKDRDIAWSGATRAQACDAARAVLPVATKSTVGIFASGQALENLIMQLQSDLLPEARQSGQQILDEARKMIPSFLERADKPDRGGATIAYRANTRTAVAELANQLLSNSYTDGTPQPVTLTEVWPRNETDIAADMLYEHSHLSLKEIQSALLKLPYTDKTAIMSAYFGERLNRRHRPGRALEKVHYSWDLVCDYGIFRDLQRHRMVDDLEWQELTPRYGFEVPDLIDEAGLTDDFENCFEISLKLHSILQQAGYRLEAQYATLLGHKMRWKVTYNAREAFHLHELRTSPQGHPGYRKLVLQMHAKLSEVHPIIGEAMKFVNKGEDEALTRLAAERYTQFKLNQLN